MSTFEDALAEIRGSAPPRPKFRFDRNADYLEATRKGDVRVGDVFRVGDFLYKAAPRGERDYEAALSDYSPEGRARIEAVYRPYEFGSTAVAKAPHGPPSFQDALTSIRSGNRTPTPPEVSTPARAEKKESLGAYMEGLSEEAKGLFPSIKKAAEVSAGKIAEMALPKIPTSFAEALKAIRFGQAPVPPGPLAAVEPTALLEKAGGAVKEAAGAVLKSETPKKGGLFSKTIGKLLLAPTEIALGVPPGLLGKIEDAVGEAAVSEPAQEALREAVLSAPFKPSEFQEAIGAEGVFSVGGPAIFRAVLGRFPGMAARLGFEEAGPALRAAAKTMKVPVSPDEIKAFITGVGEIDPVLVNELKSISGTMSKEKFSAAVKDILAGKRKFFVHVPEGTQIRSRLGLPGPGGAKEAPATFYSTTGQGPSFEDVLSKIRRGEGMEPVIGELNQELTKNVLQKQASGERLTAIEEAISRALAGVPTEADLKTLGSVSYNIPYGTTGRGNAVQPGPGTDILPGGAPPTDVGPGGVDIPAPSTGAGTAPGGPGEVPVVVPQGADAPPVPGGSGGASLGAGPAGGPEPSSLVGVDRIPDGGLDAPVGGGAGGLEGLQPPGAMVPVEGPASGPPVPAEGLGTGAPLGPGGPSGPGAEGPGGGSPGAEDVRAPGGPGEEPGIRPAAAEGTPSGGEAGGNITPEGQGTGILAKGVAPGGPSQGLIGSRVRLKSTGPRSYSIIEQLPPEPGDLPGEKFFRVKDEKTGQISIVEYGDLSPIRARAKGIGKEVLAPGGIPRELEDRALLGDAGLLNAPPPLPPAGPPPDTPASQGTESLPPIIEMPELVEMAHDLLGGKYPKIFEKMKSPGTRGYFAPGKEEIVLSADIAKDGPGAAKTLAHEIGHLIDWLPDKDIGRGNILGRIGSLRRYMNSMIEAMPNQAGRVLSVEERKGVHSKIVIDLIRKAGGSMQQFIKDPVFRKQISSQIPEMYKRRMEALAAQRGLVTKEQVMMEMKRVTEIWKPFDPLADPGYTAYRYSSPELYADAVSVLFNNPALLKQQAPIFYKSWFNYLERKPDVRAEYHGITDRINSSSLPEARQARVEAMFEAGERQAAAERLAAEERPRDIVAGLRRALIDKNEGILARVREAKKKGITPRPEDNPIYWLEEMNYSSSEVKGWLQAYGEIQAKLKEEGIGWGRLGEVLFHQRVIGERGKLFNPLGFSPESSAAQLEFIRGQMGDSKWGVLMSQTEKYRENWKFIVGKLSESEMMSPTLEAKILANPEYATFDVFAKHADDLSGGGSGAGAKIYGQAGTLQEIGNPATATLMKGVALIKAVNKNMAAKKTAEFLAESFGPDVIRPAEERWNGFAREPLAPKERGKGLLTYMEGGRLKGFVVDEPVAQAFRNDPNVMQPVVEALRLSMKFFREVFVQRNPGFMAFNLIRDYLRAYKNLPKAGLADVSRLYYKSMGESFRRGFDIPDPLVKEMLQKKMLITMEEKWGLSTEDEQIRALMDRYSPGEAKGEKGIAGALKAAYKWVGDVGSAIEAMPKISGYKYLKEHQKELGLSDEVIGHMLRTQIGSPDFLRRGSAYGIYNGFLMFANPIKEGWRGDLGAMRERPGEYAWKTAKLNLIPKLLMWGAGLGMMGAGLKEVFDSASEYDKTNYLLIPLGMTDNGKAVYIRVPQDEAGRALSGVFWKMVNMDKEKNVADLLDFMAGQAPTLNPALSLMAQAVMYASGKNPYDFFRQRNVVPEQVFEAGGARSHAAFIKHLWNSAGLGIVYRFPTDDLDKVKTTTEKVVGAPILSNTLGRFLKITNYGKFEELQRVARASRRGQARRALDERDAVVANVNSAEKPDQAEAGALYGEMVKNGMLRRRGGTSVVPFNTFLSEYRRFASRKGADPYVNALVFARGNEERASLLAYYRRTLKPVDYDKVVATAMAGGHLTMDPLALSFIKEDDDAK